jgi:hypothetical protein
MMKKLIQIAAATAALFFNSMPAGAQERDESIRTATYNAFLLSPFFKCFNPNFLDCLIQINGETEKWANHLADQILLDAKNGNLDLVVLNEIWDEDAKSILIRRLRRAFPNFVRKIDADLIQARPLDLQKVLNGQPSEVVAAIFGGVAIDKINGEDSGLMLFANRKFRFQPLPDPAFKWGTAPDQLLHASTSEVAFTLFEGCGSADCFSAKGAGLVRLRHTSSGRIYNVVFTHMQADYPDDNEFFRNERASQFDQIGKLLDATLGDLKQREREGERILMMGDLNVAPLTTGQAEWSALFNSPGSSFFSKPMYDSWWRTNSPQYPGITNDNDKDRLDYILSFPRPYDTGGVEGPMCVQHMTIPTAYRDLESDHYMVHADLNLGFHFCHPQIAHEVSLQLAPGGGGAPKESTIIDDENGTDVTQIVYPGAMQWFHVKRGAAGTYSIGRTNPNVDLTVYAPEDLTTPISKYNKTTTVETGDREQRFFTETFVLPSEFYIRLTGNSQSFTGDYALWIKRHTCANKAEACLLQPGQEQAATLTKAGNPFGTQNEAWFRFDVTGTSDVGIDQTITLTASGLPDPGNFKADLSDFINTSGLPQPAGMESGDKRIFKSEMGDGSEGYLVIAQGAGTGNDVRVRALMDTSIRLLDIFNLTCIDETNPEFGSDDIFTTFDVDGVVRRAPSSGDVEFDCDEPRDEKNWVGALGTPTLTFVDKVGVRVIEDDDSSPNDPSRFNLVPALGVNQTKLDGRDEPLDWRFEDGHYRMTFMLRKRPNAPVK